MADKLKTPSVLAFERKLDPSDALFFSGDWNDRDAHLAWPKLDVREKSVRGTISNRFEDKGPGSCQVGRLDPESESAKSGCGGPAA